ncbi:hypothetical protein L6R52_41465, partial [Myxococcota bacterium]|nr:hypothetical protein [Myxococcota bacterium]
RDAAPTPAPAESGAAAAARLRRMLEADDLKAAEVQRQLAPVFRSLDPDAAQRLQRQVERFAYAEALETLARFQL